MSTATETTSSNGPSEMAAPYLERIGAALLAGLYEEQARRAGKQFSNRTYVPGVLHLSEPRVEEMANLSIADLAAAKNDPTNPLHCGIKVKCSQGCGAEMWVTALTAMFGCACEPCIDKALKKAALEKAKGYWESICPPAFRDTDKKHNEFPTSQYEATKGFCGEESMLFYGPSRTGKTRLAMMLIKRCLVRYNRRVGVMWPEQLKAVKGLRDTLELVEKWGSFEVLLLDDALLSGAHDERVTDFLKDLLDYRMRYKRHHIITSQVGSEDYKQQADKFDNMTKADEARIDALLKRVKETSRVVPFVPVEPKEGEEAF